MATAPSPNDLTRQQLDELDALLQRMLSLPLNSPDVTATPPPASGLEFAPLPTPPIRDPAPSSVPFVPPQPRRVEPAPTPQLLAAPVAELPPPPLVPLPTPRRSSAALLSPPVEPPPVEEPTWSTPLPKPIATPETEPVGTAAAPVPILLLPLVTFNLLVNGSLGLLGFPGRVLRSGFVKNLLGLAGLCLIVYTAVYVASAQLSLPITLPWPR